MPMMIIAHRGFTGGRPELENTMEAFEAAVALGVDGIETDLRLSADGEIILVHDHQTASGRRFYELSLAECRAETGLPVPRLDEALAAWPELFWNLEIKDLAVLPALARRLDAAPAGGRLLVSSSWHAAVTGLDGLAPRNRAVLLRHRPLDLTGYLKRLGRECGIGAVVWDFSFLDAEGAAAAAAAGMESHAYNVLSEADLRDALDLDLTGVITDVPDRVMTWRATGDSGGT